MKSAKKLPWRIKAKNQRQAKDRYFRFLVRSLGCVTNDHHWLIWPSKYTKDELVATPAADPLQLQCSADPNLFLKAAQNFHYVPHPDYPGEWKVKTDRYAYSLSLTEGFDQELLAFHWHPGSSVTTPHVHAALVGGPSFHKIHIPTGRIFLEDVIRLAIEGFGVVPLRDDWSAMLGDAADRVREFGSWK